MRLVLTTSILMLSILAKAEIRLPKLIRDSMVLQRDMPLPIWGWGAPKEAVKLEFNGRTYKTMTSSEGKWKLVLPAQKAGGPYQLKIKGTNEIILKDILIGDVWFCSGQSNMVHQLNIHDVTYAAEIASANHPQIRQFWVPQNPQLAGPTDDLPFGYWKSAVGEDVRPFSAVAYFFALSIYKETGVPIGIINASIGGTPIEAWTSEQGLRDFSDIQRTILSNKDTAKINASNRAILASMKPSPVIDKGLTEAIKWYDPAYIPNGWKSIFIPGYWEDQGIKDLNGVVWYRKTIDVPASMVHKPARLFMGRIVDADVVYINGKEVGRTTYMYPQRRYTIAADAFHPGKNIITIRVTNQAGKGGFVPDKPYYLVSGNDTLLLDGQWQYKVGEVYPPSEPTVQPLSLQVQPTALFNGMVAPIIPYAIKGVLWYQGESNVSRANQYQALQITQIRDWRVKWNSPNLPFIYAQLPGFLEYTYLPVESQWAKLREAQRKALGDTNVAMVVTIDLGEWNDIHPDNKKSVGERMALLARQMVYGQNLSAVGPIFDRITKTGNTVEVTFKNATSGLRSNDGEALREFALAGADKKFYWATARIDGQRVVLRCNEVLDPQFIRFGWADNPMINLYNAEGLPAMPFEAIIQ